MRIALAQVVSTADPSANLHLVSSAVRDAAEAGARLLVLPEATMCRFGVPLGPVAEPLDGPWAGGVRAMAAAAGLTVVVGMFTPGDGGRVRNTLLVTGGGVEARYDKVHLYDAHGFAESATVTAGSEPVVVDVDGVGVGLATCYDLRFPGLFQVLADRGAVVTAVPSSWGAGPGKAGQWEVLVRARAMDSTCWVAAAGQGDPATTGATVSGSAPRGIGLSMLVSPLGEVLGRLGAAAGLLVLDAPIGDVAAARAVLPVLTGRRF